MRPTTVEQARRWVERTRREYEWADERRTRLLHRHRRAVDRFDKARALEQARKVRQ